MSAGGTAPDLGPAMTFEIFVQPWFVDGFAEPETVVVRPPAFSPRLADDRFAVIWPAYKEPYGDGNGPPFAGALHPLPPFSAADPAAGLDRADPESSEPRFLAAHMYGVLRWAYEIWAGYRGRDIDWFCAADFPRLEVVPAVEWDNAQCGYGFIEAGQGVGDGRRASRFCLNFDVLAHELGHAILYSTVGVPAPGKATAEYRGFHEALSDLVALLSALNAPRFLDVLFEKTQGDLYTRNELTEVGELPDARFIRSAANALKMDDVRPPGGELTQAAIHRLGLPLLGAFFDILAGFYLLALRRDGLIDAGLFALAQEATAMAERRANEEITDAGLAAYRADVQARFDAACRPENEERFKAALAGARDRLGCAVSHSLDPLAEVRDELSYARVAAIFRAQAAKVLADLPAAARAEHDAEIVDAFAWRGIRPSAR